MIAGQIVKNFSRRFIDVAIIVVVFLTGFIGYGSFYKENENEFKFYQKYLFSAVNIYCLKDPDSREYNYLNAVVNERIDLSTVSCGLLEKSPKVTEPSYFNGWHDTHPIFSTLVGYSWRWGDFTWQALWPIAGSLGAIAVLSFYLILRGYGIPWYSALLLFPSTIPLGILERNVYYLRDFSKVPFILLSFAFIGILFKPNLSYRARLWVLAASTCTIAIGTGFRQDSIVLIPAILAGAAFTSSVSSKRGLLRFAGEVAVIFSSFFLASSIIGLLKTSQIAQLQGYPHFLVQGFADLFWSSARMETPGISFLALYSDALAWAAVDANSQVKVGYFTALDPQYTSSGLDLISKYAHLSAADMVVRIFQGLSVIAHDHWIIKPPGIWLILFLALIAFGKWRLSFFLMFTILSLTAAGSLQFSARHSLHLIVLDRVILVIVVAALLAAVRQHVTFGLDTNMRLALYSGVGGAVLTLAIVVGAHFVQYASLNKLKDALERAPWFASQEAYGREFPKNPEAIQRFAIDRSKCSSDRLEASVELEGQKVSWALDLSDGRRRFVYFAVFDPSLEKLAVDVTPRECVAERSWGPLGDGSITPLQFFDPETALGKETIRRRLFNLVLSFL